MITFALDTFHRQIDAAFRKGAPPPQGPGLFTYGPLTVNVSHVTGSRRNGRIQMYSYSDIPGTMGADGEPFDVYVSNDPTGDSVTIIDQLDPATGEVDEHKAMLGWPSEAAAVHSFVEQMGGGARLGGAVTVSLQDFADWAEADGQASAVPFADIWDEFMARAPAEVRKGLFWRAKLGFWKAAGHKYIKRVPKANGGYRYYYSEGHGGGVHNQEHIQTGASFKHGEGHYHVTGTEGDKVTVKHDTTGHTETLSRSELSNRLREHHGAALDAYLKRAEGALSEARANKASPKQIARLEQRVKAAGGGASAPKVQRLPASEAPKEVTWTNSDKLGNPASVGSIYKTSNGHHVVITGLGRSTYTSAADNEDFYGKYNGATWRHPATVRAATDAEVEHYEAARRAQTEPREAHKQRATALGAALDAAWDQLPRDEQKLPPLASATRVGGVPAIVFTGYNDPTKEYEAKWGPRTPSVQVFEHEGKVYASRKYGVGDDSYSIVRAADVDSPAGKAMLEAGRKIPEVEASYEQARKAPAPSGFIPSPDAAAIRAAAAAPEPAAEPRRSAPPAAPRSTSSAPPSRSGGGGHGISLEPGPTSKTVYLTGNTFAHKERIKSAGATWDPGRKAWKLSRGTAEALLDQLGKRS